MGSRKRSRPNPKVEVKPKAIEGAEERSQASTSSSHGPSQDATGPEDTVSTVIVDGDSDVASLSQSQKSRTWYAGGTWPRIQKSTPSTKVARETILADKTSNPGCADFSKFEPKKPDAVPLASSAMRPPSMSLGKGKETLNMTLASAGTPTEDKLNTMLGGEQSTTMEGSAIHGQQQEQQSKASLDDAKRPVTASGWLGWLGAAKTDNLAGSQRSDDLPVPSAEAPVEHVHPEITEMESQSPTLQQQELTAPTSRVSWFGFWPATTQAKPPDEVKDVEVLPEVIPEETHLDNSGAQAPPTQDVTNPAPGSTWAFWSKETRVPGQTGDIAAETGALAIKGEYSQDRPVPAQTSSPNETTRIETATQRKRGRPSSAIEEISQNGNDSKKPFVTNIDPSSGAGSTPKLSQSETDKKATLSQNSAPAKLLPANLLLPSFHGTYRLMENPSILQQITRLIMHGREAPTSHVHLLREPPKIKKALAIGIHGLFPAALLRTVIGQPTGTSIRFANHAAAAIHRWADQHGYSDGDVEVEKIALEGEGKIAERVDNLWKLLLNWIDHVRTADFILVACHSQGVPVAVMLVAKLIEFGVITSARVGICAMAGVSLGPFADYKSRLFSGSAAELFDFANPESEVSKRYEDCLRVALNYGARINYIGSIDDQLVSLESAIFASAHHPYIHRSVFVDGRVHAPDFIAHLVGFALKLRNLGVSDHGLIRELSVPLAGSLYTGEGHSRLYDEAKIYDVAIQFALESSSVGKIPLKLQKYEVPTNSNPFQLPWSMRGLLEEDIIKTELDHETKELLQQFDEWKPSTKVLKDVKYRLEAIKSKL